MLKELKQSHNFEVEKRKALTVAEQNLFMDFLKRTPQYNHWYPVFAVMLGTGMRVGETVGLRWCDINLDEGYIDVNHTLVYYSRGEGLGCKFAINTPKTKAGVRQIPMMDFVKDAFLLEKKYQEEIASKFNPKNFNAKEIVSYAKKAGMKYIVITAKHHEGLALWDTKVESFKDYTGTKTFSLQQYTPFGASGRDILMELNDNVF